MRQAPIQIGVHGMTVTEALVFGSGANRTRTYRTTEDQLEFVGMLKLEMVLEDAAL